MRHDLTNDNVVLAPAKDADVQVNVLEERRDKQILSLSGAGRVSEYTLRLVVRYQLVDGKGKVIIPTSEIQLTRILGYDDTKIIAKQQEETMLYSDMVQDVVGQIIRRMIAVKRNV
jgi:LPS-assembly lipoprotein